MGVDTCNLEVAGLVEGAWDVRVSSLRVVCLDTLGSCLRIRVHLLARARLMLGRGDFALLLVGKTAIYWRWRSVSRGRVRLHAVAISLS